MANEARHTPGPWMVQYGHETGYPRGIYAPGDANKKGAVGCVVRFNGIGLPSSEAGLANARLIAASPDLFQAAEQFLASVKDGNVADLIDYYADIFGEAVAKATGSPQ